MSQTPVSSFGPLSFWKHVIEKTYGSSGLEILHDRVRQGQRNSSHGLHASGLVSLAFWDKNEICADDTVTTMMLYHAARESEETIGVKSLELRHPNRNLLYLSSYGTNFR